MSVESGVMPGPSWPALGVTVLASGPREALFCADVLPQLSCMLSGAGGWCRADPTLPSLLWRALLEQSWVCEAGEGPAHWRGRQHHCISKYCSCVFTSTPTRMFYIF